MASHPASRPTSAGVVLEADPRRRSAASAASAAPRSGALDLHEGIDDVRRSCPRWPEELRLLNLATGELFEGRCRATNLCTYCRTLYVVETVEMLTLDAVEWPPTLWIVLTAREHLTRAECRRHLRQLLLAARRRWPGVQWFVQVEFQRRGALHLNLLVKGVDVGDVRALYDVVTGRWCSRVDAIAAPYDVMEHGGQWAGVVEDGVSTVRYISKMLAHGLKAEQQPPIGWRGHRTSQTRGYLVRPASVMREEARASLGAKRRLWRAFNRMLEVTDNRDVPEITEAIYDELTRRAELARYELVRVNPSTAMPPSTRPVAEVRGQSSG